MSNEEAGGDVPLRYRVDDNEEFIQEQEYTNERFDERISQNTRFRLMVKGGLAVLSFIVGSGLFMGILTLMLG